MPRKSKEKKGTELQKKSGIIAPTKAVIPSWEDPIHRFFEGWGELKTPDQNGRTFTIWEAAIYIPEDKFPIWVGERGLLITRENVLWAVAEMLVADSDAIPVSEGEKQKLRDLVRSLGFDVPDPSKIDHDHD